MDKKDFDEVEFRLIVKGIFDKQAKLSVELLLKRGLKYHESIIKRTINSAISLGRRRYKEGDIERIISEELSLLIYGNTEGLSKNDSLVKNNTMLYKLLDKDILDKRLKKIHYTIKKYITKTDWDRLVEELYTEILMEKL